LYSLLIEIGIPIILIRLSRVYLNETYKYSKVHLGKHLSDIFPIKDVLKQDELSPLLFSFALESVVWSVQE
jgi:hypothetical protein